MESKLRECPFCNAEPVYKSETDPNPPHQSRAWLKCPQCRQAQVCSDWYGGDLGTMEASWNTRASHPDYSALLSEEAEDRMAIMFRNFTGSEMGNYGMLAKAAITEAIRILTTKGE